MAHWSNRRKLIAILAIAFLFRASAAIALQAWLDHRLHRQFLVEGDANGYWALAESIVAGRPYQIYDPPRAVLRMPGFPALLAIGMKAADLVGLAAFRPLVVRLWLAAIGALACGAVYLLGKTLFDARTGLLAAFLAAATPSMIGFSVLELSETAFALGLVLSLWCFQQTRRQLEQGREIRAIRWSMMTGLTVAAANFVRPSWLLAAPMMAAALILERRRHAVAWLAAVMLVVSLGLALTPWAWRNHRVTGHWIWTTLWVGPSLYDGLNPQATGDSDMRFFDRERLPEQLSEYDVDHHYRRRAWEFVRENPGGAVVLAFRKLGRYFNPVPNAEQFSSVGIRLLFGISFVPHLCAALYAAWRFRGTWRTWIVCVLPILYFAAIHSVFVGSLRYRLPAEYPLLVLAAAGWIAAFSRRSEIALP